MAEEEDAVLDTRAAGAETAEREAMACIFAEGGFEGGLEGDRAEENIKLCVEMHRLALALYSFAGQARRKSARSRGRRRSNRRHTANKGGARRKGFSEACRHKKKKKRSLKGHLLAREQMRASLAALALALARRHFAPRSPVAFASAWARSSPERARKGAFASDRLPMFWASAFSSTPPSSSSSPLNAALAEAWASAAAAAPVGDDEEDEVEDEDKGLDRAISVLEAELLLSRKEGSREAGASRAASPLSAAAAFEAVALFRLWRCSSSGNSKKYRSSGGDDARASLALAERAAARAVSLASSAASAAEADGSSEETARAVQRLCSLRHAAALAALGRGGEASKALEAFESKSAKEPSVSSLTSSSSSSSSEEETTMITSLHLAEARFYRELVSPPSSIDSSSRSLAAALSALDGDEISSSSPVVASRVCASALAALRGSLEALLADGKLTEARRLAEAEAEALESRARAEEEATRRERGAAVATATETKNSTSAASSPSSTSPPIPSAEAAAHAKYRLATLAYSSGDRDALSLARAALGASVKIWGPDDDRSWLRRHRVAAAALADEVVLGVSDAASSPSSSSAAAAAAASSSLGNDDGGGGGGASSSPPPATPSSSSSLLRYEEIGAEASRALGRFRERLGGESGLAGEARLVSAAARLLRLRGEGEQRRREAKKASSSSSSPSSPLAAFEAVLSPKREADAAAEVERGFREMVRGCSGGAEHPLVKRASEIREALLRGESEKN